jgi:hypothetical protein
MGERSFGHFILTVGAFGCPVAEERAEAMGSYIATPNPTSGLQQCNVRGRFAVPLASEHDVGDKPAGIL